MILLRLISLPYFRKHVLRSVLTTAGIVLGVALLVGMRTADQSVLRSFSSTVDRIAGKAQLQASAADIDVEKHRLTDAPLVIGIVSFTKPHPKVPPWEQELSAGASAMNMVTAATALGYGACWLTGWFAFDRDVLDGLGLKADEKLAGFIHIGTKTKPNEDRPRPALSDIVTRF